MGKHSRDKGATFERLIVRKLRERFGWSGAQCYRGAPMQAQAWNRLPDVVTPIEFLWIECGHGKQVSPLAKLTRATAASGAMVRPVAVTRRDHQPMVVSMWLDDAASLLGMRQASLAPVYAPIVSMAWDNWLDMVDEWWPGVRG